MNSNFNLHFKRIPCLKSGEVHIWSAYLPDNEKDIHYFATILSEDELQKVNDFRFSKDQKYFMISRGILRSLLGRYLGQAPEKVEIIYGLWGKPCILAEQSLHFNLSHSKDYAIYAVTHCYEVGIDLEYINYDLDLEGVALSILSSQELAYWNGIASEEKVSTFFKLWVCKEAFLKAGGKGWLSDQQTISLEGLEPLTKNSRLDPLNKEMVFPYYLEFIPNYASALYIEGTFLRPLFYTWNSKQY